MAEPTVLHSDLELFLTGWYRSALGARPEAVCANVKVDRVESNPLPAKLVVIRDDGGADAWFLTGERSVGVSILCATKSAPKDAKDLAAIAYGIRTLIPSTALSNPVSAVLSSTSPVMVDEAQDRARVYFTLQLAVVGQPL